MGSVVERVGGAVAMGGGGSVQAIVAPLPQVWALCGGGGEGGGGGGGENQQLLRGAILRLAMQLVGALGADSAALAPLALPMVQQALRAGSDEAIYLTEDALELWQALLQHAPAYTPELHGLFAQLPSALGIVEQRAAAVAAAATAAAADGSGGGGAAAAAAAAGGGGAEGSGEDWEHVKVVMGIAQSYLVIGGGTFIGAHAGSLAVLLERATGALKPRIATCVVRTMECLFCLHGGALPPGTAHAAGSAEAEATARAVGATGGALAKVLQACLRSAQAEANADRAPSRLEAERARDAAEPDFLLCGYLSILARCELLASCCELLRACESACMRARARATGFSPHSRASCAPPTLVCLAHPPLSAMPCLSR